MLPESKIGDQPKISHSFTLMKNIFLNKGLFIGLCMLRIILNIYVLNTSLEIIDLSLSKALTYFI